MENWVLDYWKRVLKKSSSRAREWFGLRGFIIDFFIAVFATYFISKPATLSDVSWNEMVITAVIIITIYVVVLGFFILREPAEINKKQEHDIGESQKRVDGLEKSVSRKNIKPLWPPLKRVHSNQIEQMIQVENDSGKELSNYYAKVENIGFRKNKEIEIRTLSFPSNMKLLWPGTQHRYVRDQEPIAPGDTRELSIAESSTNNFKFVTEKSVNNTFVDIGHYYVRFTIGGVVDQIGIKNLVQAEIKYDGGNQIEIIDIRECEEKNA